MNDWIKIEYLEFNLRNLCLGKPDYLPGPFYISAFNNQNLGPTKENCAGGVFLHPLLLETLLVTLQPISYPLGFAAL